MIGTRRAEPVHDCLLTLLDTVAPVAGTYVRYELEGDVGVVNLCREPLVVYDDAFHAQFQEAWMRARLDNSCKAIVLKSEGRHFCAGANLKGGEAAPPDVSLLPPHEEFTLVRDTMKPTIAAVQGGCVGGGQRLVFPCDIIFCTEDAFFSDPTAALGIGGIQSHIHTWLYGPRLALEMIYSGDRLPAPRLYAMGQVNRLFATVAELHREAMVFAEAIAQQPPSALRQAKRAVHGALDAMGQHSIATRMAELLDERPQMLFPEVVRKGQNQGP